ncbi:hypothetical protein N431DRAFT_121252 [Stipitochalara longipes BDJ]|nr:hypothetical protein N431DRAFT_121252 [Stipitochalara longipes BDJ]
MAGDKKRRDAEPPSGNIRGMLSRLKAGARSMGKVKDGSKESDSVAERSTPDPGTTPVSNIATDSTDRPGNQTPSSQEFCPISELWNEAYEDLRSNPKDQKLIKKYEDIMAIDFSTMVASTAQILAPVKVSRKDNMLRILDKKMTEVKDNKWRLRFHDHEVLVEDLAKPVINVIDIVDKYVSDAVSTNPYASIAWAGIGLILPIFLNPSKQSTSMATGLKTISNLIVQSSMREDLYAYRYESCKSYADQKTFLNIHIQYRKKLQDLYSLILKFQAGCVLYYYSGPSSRLLSDLVKWNDWDTAIKDIEDQNTEFLEAYGLLRNTMAEEDYLALYRNHAEANKITKSIGNDVSGLKKAIELARKDDSRKELLKWLTSVKPSTDYNSLIEKRGVTSANWFLEDKNMLKWEKNSDSLLWLNGKVGSGKSVLSALAIDWITKLYEDNPETAIAYWYFTFSDTTKQNISEMYRALIRQLLSRRPDTPEAVKTLHRYQESGQDPSTVQLENTLATTIRGFSNVYIVIDALDECPIGNNQRERLLTSFSRLLEKTSQNLHMLWTSRSEPDIEIAFNGLTHPSTRINFDLASRQRHVNLGITRHIDNTLALEPCKNWPEGLQAEVREALVKKADGM